MAAEIHALPLTALTGTRSFYFSTEDGIIRAANKNGKYADKMIRRSTVTRRTIRLICQRLDRIKL